MKLRCSLRFHQFRFPRGFLVGERPRASPILGRRFAQLQHRADGILLHACRSASWKASAKSPYLPIRSCPNGGVPRPGKHRRSGSALSRPISYRCTSRTLPPAYLSGAHRRQLGDSNALRLSGPQRPSAEFRRRGATSTISPVASMSGTPAPVSASKSPQSRQTP